MAEDTKIVHVAVVDGEPQHIKALNDRLKKLKNDLNFEVEFVVTNDKVNFRDAKWLIQEIYQLMKREKIDKKGE